MDSHRAVRLLEATGNTASPLGPQSFRLKVQTALDRYLQTRTIKKNTRRKGNFSVVLGILTEDTLVYKEVYVGEQYDTAIVTLLAPKGAKIRWQATRLIHYPSMLEVFRNKARCSEAKVLAITGHNGNKYLVGTSAWDRNFKYRVGETVKPVDGFEHSHEECSGGIHFFATKAEAKGYLS